MSTGFALVLGGGGSRGLAHVGVLEVLEREGYRPEFIVGTSMGAIIGAMYAMGMSPQEIGEKMQDMQGMNVFGRRIFTARGRQESMRQQLQSVIGDMTFASLKIPMVATAVDMVKGEEVVLGEGKIVPAVLASSAVPGVFPPVEIGDMQLLDGGVIDSVATNVAYHFGYHEPDKVIIAVDVYPPLNTEHPWTDPVTSVLTTGLPFDFRSLLDSSTPGIVSSLWRSFKVLAWHVHDARLRDNPPDVLIRPILHGTGSMDFTDLQTPYFAGVEAAESKLSEIAAVLNDTKSDFSGEAASD